MRIYRLAFTALLAPLAALAFAQDFDDIYYNPKTDAPKTTEPKTKKQTRNTESSTTRYSGADARAIYYQMTDYAPAGNYSPEDITSSTSTRSVDEYNRRGIFAEVDTLAVDSAQMTPDEFTYTSRIKRFYNPSVAENDEFVSEYLASPNTTVNIYVNDPGYYGYWGLPWNYGFYSPYYGGPYGYWNSWAWSPAWSWGWGWGPSWSIGWNWGWNWGWGPAWGPVHGGWTHPHRPSWGNQRPGGIAGRPQRPASGQRPGAYRPGNTQRPSWGNGANRPGSSTRPGSSDDRYRPSAPSNNSNNNGTYQRQGNNGRNNSSNGASYNRGGSSGSRSTGGFGGGSRGGGGGGGRGRH